MSDDRNLAGWAVGRQVFALDLFLACRYKVATWFGWFIGQRLAAAGRAVLSVNWTTFPNVV